MDSANIAKQEQSVEEEIINLLASQALLVPLPMFLGAAMIAAVAAPHVSVSWLAFWLTLVAIALLLRGLVLSKLPVVVRLTLRQRIGVAIFMSAANAAALSLSLIFFSELSVHERAVHSLLLVSLAAGSVAAACNYRPLFLANVTLTLWPLSLLWIVTPVEGARGWIYQITGVVIAGLSVVLIVMAREGHSLIREAIETKLRQAELSKRLKYALDAAESASFAKTRFLASASHDLRQPVHTLSLFAAALEMRPLDERSREISQHINLALQVLAAQLDSLLDVSKLDAGVVEVKAAPIAVSELLDRIRREFEPIAREKGIDLTLSFDASLRVRTDVTLLERIVRNLASNAVKYTEQGCVHIEARRLHGLVVLRIADTGVGIPEAEQNRVFEEFYQLSNPARDRTKGLGLGLAIVRRLADLLGVRMEMVSRTGSGTEFFLFLDDAGIDVPSMNIRQIPEPSAVCLNVLVVDDEDAIRKGMCMLLEAMGATAVLADGVEGARAAVLSWKPDLILADLRLSGIESGIDAIEAVRELHPGTPALLISGETLPQRMREAEAAGLRLLHKPVSASMLRREMAGCVETAALRA